MTAFKSKLGVTLSLAYLIICAALIYSQGLFGESFIAIILGLPLSMVLAAFEFGNVTGPLLYVLVLLPIAFNAFVLYWIGALLSRLKKA